MKLCHRCEYTWDGGKRRKRLWDTIECIIQLVELAQTLDAMGCALGLDSLGQCVSVLKWKNQMLAKLTLKAIFIKTTSIQYLGIETGLQ